MHGEIRAQIHTVDPETVLHAAALDLGRTAPPDRSLNLVSGRIHGGVLLLRFAGVDSPEAARNLTGLDLWLPRDRLPPLEEGDYYWEDLIGMTVLEEAEAGDDADGPVLGVVDNLFATGANDVMTVRQADGSERLLPFIDEVVRHVDLERGVITVHLIPGL